MSRPAASGWAWLLAYVCTGQVGGLECSACAELGWAVWCAGRSVECGSVVCLLCVGHVSHAGPLFCSNEATCGLLSGWLLLAVDVCCCSCHVMLCAWCGVTSGCSCSGMCPSGGPGGARQMCAGASDTCVRRAMLCKQAEPFMHPPHCCTAPTDVLVQLMTYYHLGRIGWIGGELSADCYVSMLRAGRGPAHNILLQSVGSVAVPDPLFLLAGSFLADWLICSCSSGRLHCCRFCAGFGVLARCSSCRPLI